MVDGRWLDCVSHHDQLFRDEYALYRPLQVIDSDTADKNVAARFEILFSLVGIKSG